jgi:hypothetical protein
MAIYKKLDIATFQLNQAIGLLVSGYDYFSAITLAGAADGIYCGLLSAENRKNFNHDLVQLEHELNGTVLTVGDAGRGANDELMVNKLKHWERGESESLEFDPEICALGAITKAVANNILITAKHSPEIGALYIWIDQNSDRFKSCGIDTSPISNLVKAWGKE